MQDEPGDLDRWTGNGRARGVSECWARMEGFSGTTEHLDGRMEDSCGSITGKWDSQCSRVRSRPAKTALLACKRKTPKVEF